MKNSLKLLLITILAFCYNFSYSQPDDYWTIRSRCTTESDFRFLIETCSKINREDKKYILNRADKAAIIGDAYFMLKEYPKAIEYYNTALNICNSDEQSIRDAAGGDWFTDIPYRKAITKLAMGDFNGCIEELNICIKAGPVKYVDGPESKYYLLRGIAYEKLNEYQLANNEYSKIINKPIFGYDISEHLAYTLLRRADNKYLLKDTQGAINDYTSSISEGSKYLRGVANKKRADIYCELKKYKEAVEDYKTAIEYLGEVNNQIGQADIQEALVKRSNYIHYYLNYNHFRYDIGNNYEGRLYCVNGDANYNNKDYKKAAENYTKAITIFFDNKDYLSDLYYQVGNCKFYLKEYSAANTYYSKSIEIRPNFLAYFQRAYSEYYNGNNQQSIDDLTKALTFKTDMRGDELYFCYSSRSSVYYKLGDYKSYISDFSMCIDIKPTIDKYYNRGKAYLMKLNDAASAQPDFQKVIDMDANSTFYTAFAKFYLGEREEGIKFMEKLVESSAIKDRKINCYNLACLHALNGNEYTALAYIDSAIMSGYNTYAELKSDDDFETIKYKPGFKNLLAKYNIKNDIEMTNFSEVIKNEVKVGIAKWQVKGEFETNQQYSERMSKREAKVTELTNRALETYKNAHREEIDWKGFTVEKYDAESQSFKITNTSSGDIAVVKVPIAEAPAFKENQAKLVFSNQNFILQKDAWVLSNMDIKNPTNGKVYKYDITKQANYDPSTKFVLNYDDVKIDLPNQNVALNQKTSNNSNTKIVLGKPEVDTNIPTASTQKTNTYCLIIGNEDYSSYQTGLSTEVNVDFAANDAKIFKEYCNKILGIPEKQIKLLVNATAGQMNQGMAWLTNLAKIDNGEAELILYYSGHGLPDEATKEAYLIPVDISGSNVTQGIKVNDVYARLNEFPSKKITVFLDACFSGGARNQGLVAMKGVKFRPKDNIVTGNMVVFSSSTGEESSGVYREMQHGYMTYFLLKKMQETKGEINYKEFANYIINSVKKETALSGKIQTPQVNFSPAVEETWINWILK